MLVLDSLVYATQNLRTKHWALGFTLLTTGLSLLLSPLVSAAAAGDANFTPGTNSPEPHVPCSARRDEENARFTWYDAGEGACGGDNDASDFIVALSSEQWDGGSHCYKMITISYEDKTTQAQIVDECPGCPWGALDLSEGLFAYLAPPDEGVIYGNWRWHSRDTATKRVEETAAAALPDPAPQPEQPEPSLELAPALDVSIGVINVYAAPTSTSASAMSTTAPHTTETALSDASAAATRIAVNGTTSVAPTATSTSKNAGNTSASPMPTLIPAADLGAGLFHGVGTSGSGTSNRDINWAFAGIALPSLLILQLVSF